MVDEVLAGCDPLGLNNKLIFSPGLLVGHRLSSCDRISIGTKFPLTRGIKEADAGGRTRYQLAVLGIKALIIEDFPKSNTDFFILHIGKEGARFSSVNDLAGKGIYEIVKILLERFGDKATIAGIGVGGEMRLHAVGIQYVDKDGVPSRISARGGVGAVMGEKGLKAIVIDASDIKPPKIHDQKTFKEAKKRYTKDLISHPQTELYCNYGTISMTMICNYFGAIPTRNFSSGVFEHAEIISGEYMRDLLLKRGRKAQPSHACMAGCVIQCSNVFTDESSNDEIVSPLESETAGLMGSNLGIGDLDEIAQLNYEVNDLGLDSIEIGAALGVAAEGGLFAFGDSQATLHLLFEIRTGSPTGRMLGHGAATTGQILGVRRVPVVKGQAMPSYEPRVIKGTGVTYATSPQGSDHTCGLTIRAKTNHKNPEGQTKLSQTAQINIAGVS